MYMCSTLLLFHKDNLHFMSNKSAIKARYEILFSVWDASTNMVLLEFGQR